MPSDRPTENGDGGIINFLYLPYWINTAKMNITVLPEVRKYTYSNALYVVHVHVHVLYVYSTCTRRSKMMSVLNIFHSIVYYLFHSNSCPCTCTVVQVLYTYSRTRTCTAVHVTVRRYVSSNALYVYVAMSYSTNVCRII